MLSYENEVYPGKGTRVYQFTAVHKGTKCSETRHANDKILHIFKKTCSAPCSKISYTMCTCNTHHDRNRYNTTVEYITLRDATHKLILFYRSSEPACLLMHGKHSILVDNTVCAVKLKIGTRIKRTLYIIRLATK